MSDYAPEYPSEADAIAGNLDYEGFLPQDAYEDDFGEDYGYEEPSPPQPTREELLQAARDEGLRYAAQRMAPMLELYGQHAEETLLGQGYDQAGQILAEAGVGEADVDETIARAQMIYRDLEARGVDMSGHSEASATAILRIAAKMTTDARGLEQARATARDEQGVLNLYYPKASAHAASDVLPKGDEWSVFEKFKQAGAFAKEGGR